MKKPFSFMLAINMFLLSIFCVNINAFAYSCEDDGYEHIIDCYYNENGTHSVECGYCDYSFNEKCSLKYTNEDTQWHCEYCTKCDYFEYKKHNYKQTSTTKASPSNSGSIISKCTKCNRTKNTTISKPNRVVLSKSEFVYDGKVKKPSVTVKDERGNKISNNNYSVSYANGRKNVGTYKITVTFKGDKYKGTLSSFFKIIPKSTKISNITASKNSITVNWNKKTTQVTGYQIRYSKKSDMSSNKLITVSKNSTTKKTISGLSYNTKYYFQVRTYKTVNGKKYYSKWSEKLSKKIPAKKSQNKKTKPTADKGEVYVTETGSCYHKDSKCGNGKYYKTTLEDANHRGLRPCKKCC